MNGNGVVGGLWKRLDMRRINLFELGSYMQTSYPNQLKLMSLYNFIAMDSEVVEYLHWKMKGLSFKTVIRCNLAHPVNQGYSHVQTYFLLIIVYTFFNFNSFLYFLLFFQHVLKYIELFFKFWKIIFFDLIIYLVV